MAAPRQSCACAARARQSWAGPPQPMRLVLLDLVENSDHPVANEWNILGDEHEADGQHPEAEDRKRGQDRTADQEKQAHRQADPFGRRPPQSVDRRTKPGRKVRGQPLKPAIAKSGAIREPPRATPRPRLRIAASFRHCRTTPPRSRRGRDRCPGAPHTLAHCGGFVMRSDIHFSTRF
jgi:hypothetical protein